MKTLHVSAFFAASDSTPWTQIKPHPGRVIRVANYTHTQGGHDVAIRYMLCATVLDRGR